MPLDVLVTGGSGVLGSTVARELRRRGKSVLTCGHTPGDCDAIWDVRGSDGPSAIEIPATIVHTAAKRAALDDNKRDEVVWETNVGGTAKVVEWAIRHGVKRIVLASAALVYGDWTQPRKESEEPNSAAAGYYALSKWAAEQIASTAVKAGCEITILRFSSLYGSAYKTGLIRHFLTMGSQDRVVKVDPPVDDAFDLLHVRDAANAVANAVDHPHPGLWNVGGGEISSLMQIAQTCAALSDSRVEQSRRKARRKSRILNWVDDSRARKDIGHRNTVSLEEGIAEIAASV